MSFKEKSEFLWKTISRFDIYYNSVNAKASVLIAFNVFVVTGVAIKWSDFSSWFPQPWARVVAAGALFVAVAASIVSLWKTFATLNPFLESPKKPASYHSLIFFNHVAEYEKPEDYLEVTKSLGEDGAIKEALKIALGFLVLKKNDRGLARKLSPLVDENGAAGQIVCWSRELQPFPELDNIVHHSVVLIGSREDAILYAQTSLFGVLTCTSILDDSYSGQSFTEVNLEYPLGKPDHVTPNDPRRFTKAQIASLRAKSRVPPGDVMPRMQGIVNIGQSRMHNQAMIKQFMEGFVSVLEKPENHGVVFTDELAGDALREASIRVHDWAASRSGKKKT